MQKHYILEGQEARISCSKSKAMLIDFFDIQGIVIADEYQLISQKYYKN